MQIEYGNWERLMGTGPCEIDCVGGVGEEVKGNSE